MRLVMMDEHYKNEYLDEFLCLWNDQQVLRTCPTEMCPKIGRYHPRRCDTSLILALAAWPWPTGIIQARVSALPIDWVGRVGFGLDLGLKSVVMFKQHYELFYLFAEFYIIMCLTRILKRWSAERNN